jgi:ABC-type bacteriocin/lantibiotic exporter with double-glycine peptidase domain
MSAADLLDEVKGLGYTTTQANVNSSLDALKGAVSKGPVVAIVKLGMTSSGNNHAVVVTGISGDNHVRINDPWDGQAHTYSWDDFSRSWGANFGSDAPKNNFVEIRP